MDALCRRRFLRHVSVGALAACAAPRLGLAADQPGSKMKLGLVTYQWGKDWDLPTLLANCEKANVLAVELRTTHKHGVEPRLDAAQRAEVKKRFDDSPVVFVGPGSNENFDSPDPARLARSIAATQAFLKLSADCGGSGVKVKPNSFHKGVEHEKTIEQIGKCLNIVGKFAADLGQQVRLEVHGQCSPLPIMKQIMDVADHPAVGVCWNSNGTDLKGKSKDPKENLAHNFGLVKDRFGATAHVRELHTRSYPYPELISLFVRMDYAGWILLECSTKPKDRVAALAAQSKLLPEMIAKAQAAL